MRKCSELGGYKTMTCDLCIVPAVLSLPSLNVLKRFYISDFSDKASNHAREDLRIQSSYVVVI